jgi:hypothetical protein
LETLTPVQRVAVIAICVALTALIAMLLVPWVWTQIVERLPDTPTPAARDRVGTTSLPVGPHRATLARTSSVDMPAVLLGQRCLLRVGICLT